ncbi:MAG TPA: ABC transporter permease [Gemmatimonadaceae bacterium]|jgi:putative ABC transport system permease protein|nr:ABC transporter permease [Gemmatimonadaceae bacterium]
MFRYAFRTLAKTPAWTLAAVACLAIGIGANTTVYTLVRSLVIAPVPTPDSNGLVMLAETPPRNPTDPDYDGIAPANLVDWERQSETLERVAGFGWWDVNITGIDEPESVVGFRVTEDFFRVLGEAPAVGRAFTAEEMREGSTDRVILSYPLWQRRFGGDGSVVGTRVMLNGEKHTVVGIMGEDFIFPPGAELWTPFALDGAAGRDRDGRWLSALGRLKPGVTLEQARAEARTIARRLELQHPEYNTKWGMRVEPAQVFYGRNPRPYVLVLLASVAFVLLIGCANVANLLLARATTRGRELAVRVALGATRRDLVRQLFAESAVIAVLGGALGALLALWGVRLMRDALPADLVRFNPGWTRIVVDMDALAFTLVVSLATALIVGLIPALVASRADPQQALKESGRTATGAGGRQRLRSALVVGEVALALMLLVGTGLMVRSFIGLVETEQGYRREGVLTMQIALPSARYDTEEKQVRFYNALLDRVQTLPGVQAAGVTSAPPPAWNDQSARFILEGEPKPQSGDPAHRERMRAVSDAYFGALGIPLRAGRAFTRHDDAASPSVAVVSEALARKYWPNDNPIGKRISFVAESMFVTTVVGVVGDARHNPNVGRPALAPVVYVPVTQSPWRTMTLMVRTAGDPLAANGEVQRAIGSIDPALAAGEVMTLERMLSAGLSPQRITSGMLSVFAGIAMLLAVIGIYGVISYSVTQRTHEIGIRMALGAQQRDVIRRVLRHGFLLAAIGIGIGGVASLGMTRAMATVLHDVSPTDPLTFIIVVLVLVGVAALGSWLPARRAASVDPVVALRSDG